MELELLLTKLKMDHLEAQLDAVCEQAAQRELDLLLERLVTTLVVLAVLYVSGAMTGASALRTFSRERNDSVVIFTVLGIALFVVFNIEASAFFYAYLLPARFAAISVLWTLFSVGLMLIGFRKNSSTVRKVSIALFGVTILKVFLFDMANFSTPYRIISFIILGLVLMTAGVIVTLTVVGAIIGIPLFTIGALLVVRGLW